jgi:raffinose/stachyose/melibiose transport system permease protein
MKKNAAARMLVYILMPVIGLIWIYPLFLIFFNSLKPYRDIMIHFLDLPSVWDFSRYADVWVRLDFPKLFTNTMIYTLSSVFLTVLLASLAAYKLSRTKTKYSTLVFVLIIIPMMVPFQTYMISMIQVAKQFNMLGNRIGYIIVQTGLLMPLAVFLFHGFVKTVPRELDECAYIDGASRLRTFFSIVLPLLTPIAITVAIIDALAVWNDILINLLITGAKQDLLNIQIALYTRFSAEQSDWGTALPGIMISIAPNILFFVFMQKHIVKGITAGAIKG